MDQQEFGQDGGDSSDPEDVDVNVDEDYYDVLKKWSEKWLSVQMTHRVLEAGANAFWKLAMTFIPLLFEAKKRCNVKRPVPGFIHIRRKLYDAICPPVHMKFVYLKKSTQEEETVRCQKNPSRQYPRSQYTKLYEEAHVKVYLMFYQPQFF